ncbi:MAG: diguanylate cyclase [Lachnospiraceae bacterium]|nr:diguanylate cyclase [Lachnospiraceae bacterium]
MLSRIRNIFFYGDTDRESYNAIRPNIEEYNRIMTLLFASVAAVLISAVYIFSCFQEGIMNSRPVYAAGVVFSLILLLVAVQAKKYPALSYVGIYMAISGFLLYGIAIGTITRPEEQTVTFMVMLIFVPSLFVDKPIKVALSLIGHIVIFIFMAFRTKTGSVLATDVLDAVIFGSLALVFETVFYRWRIRTYVLENRLHVMSETDLLTGLNNRNCYENRLSFYPKMFQKSICCIYMDVNGLHELNNAKGHKAGDDMLIFIAKAVQGRFGDKHTYRVGGDEYVAFALDIPENEIEKRLAELNETIIGEGYHAAVGYEYSTDKELDMGSLIRSAETKMYAEKAEYYKGRDRRRR